jgi:hypothetical protein
LLGICEGWKMNIPVYGMSLHLLSPSNPLTIPPFNPNLHSVSEGWIFPSGVNQFESTFTPSFTAFWQTIRSKF